jgi:thymidylate synthase
MTTRKMNFNNVKVEAIWMLSGNTNIKYLLENGCRIWTADAYRAYKKYAESLEEPDYFVHVEDAVQNCVRIMTVDEFEAALIRDEAWYGLQSFADRFGDLGFTYGKAWREWPDEYGDQVINQLDRLINLLKTDPDNRRMVVSTYNPTVADTLTLPPCHTNWQVWTRELSVAERLDIAEKQYVQFDSLDFGVWHSGQQPTDQWWHDTIDELYPVPRRELSISYSMRSVDSVLGHNVHLYAMILLLLADEVGMQPGEVVANFNDTHIYENQIDGVNIMLERSPKKLPTVTVKNGLNATPDDVHIHDYYPEPFIKFPLSVG